MNDIWDNALKIIKENINSTAFVTWFKEIKPIAMNDSVFLLQPTGNTAPLICSMINSQYISIIEEALSTITEKKYQVIVRESFDENYIKSISGSKKEEVKIIPEQEPSSDLINTYVSSPLNSKYVFDNFVVGNSNQLARAAAVAVAEAPGTAYNPLFLYGNVGLGKTHLMHAIAHHILSNNPSAKIVYASCETFLNELVVAIQNHATDKFKDKYRKVDVLLIDDIQFIASKEATQIEFFHTFNAIWELNKQIIISSDRPPKEIPTLEDRLRSRFSSGLIADIQPPDFETRIAILKAKANLDNIEMPEEVFEFIAKTISSSIRELEGALTTVIAYSKLTNKELTVDLAKIALKDMIINSEKPELSIDYIQSCVANYFGVSVDELKGKRRSKNIVYPRHIAMYFCRKLLDCPLADIGSSFGGRDHSTVINGFENVSKGLENSANTTLIKNVNEIEAMFKKE